MLCPFLLQSAESAACQAATYIASQSSADVEAQHKAGGQSAASQVVTAVDHAAQKIIIDALATITQQYSLAILAEESPDDHGRLQAEAFWAIDPLDGTLNFVENIAGYSVVVALVGRNGQPLLGVIVDPRTMAVYKAMHGAGAWRNDAVWSRPTADTTRPLCCWFDRSFAAAATYAPSLVCLEKLAKDFGYQGVEVVIRGGAAMNACTVADNLPACYFKYPQVKAGGGSIWDFAASACVYQALGLYVGDFTGGPLRLNEPGTTFMHKHGVIFAESAEVAEAIRQIYLSLHNGVL